MSAKINNVIKEYDSNTKGYNDIFSTAFWRRYSFVAVLNAVVGAMYLILFILSLSGYADTKTAYVFSAIFAITCIISSSNCFRILPIWAKLLRRYRHLETIITKNYENLDPITRSEKLDKKRREDFANFVSITNQSQNTNKEYIEKIIKENAKTQEKKNNEVVESIKDLTNLISILSDNMAAINENLKTRDKEHTENKIDVGVTDRDIDLHIEEQQNPDIPSGDNDNEEIEMANNSFAEQNFDEEQPSEEEEEPYDY